MIIVSSFSLKHNIETGFFRVISNEAVNCPLCSGNLIYRDSRARKTKNLFGESRLFLIRRLLCGDCRRLHTEIPDIIQPHRHYDSEAIQAVLDERDEAKSCTADNSTILRWKAAFVSERADISQRLASVRAKSVDGSAGLFAAARVLEDIMASRERWLAFVMALLINDGHQLRTRFAFCPFPADDKIVPMKKNERKRGKNHDETITDTG